MNPRLMAEVLGFLFSQSQTEHFCQNSAQTCVPSQLGFGEELLLLGWGSWAHTWGKYTWVGGEGANRLGVGEGI
jgi:hypothetical protein